MPPPRLTRSPWPCHLPWSAHQVRRPFYGPLKKQSTRRDSSTTTAGQNNDAQSGAQDAGSTSSQQTRSPPPHESEQLAHQEQKNWRSHLGAVPLHNSSEAHLDTSNRQKPTIAELQTPPRPTTSTKEPPKQNKSATQPTSAIPPSSGPIEHLAQFVNLKAKGVDAEDTDSALPKVVQTLQERKDLGARDDASVAEVSEVLQKTSRNWRRRSPEPTDVICYHCGGQFNSNRALRRHLRGNEEVILKHLENKSRMEALRAVTAENFKIGEDVGSPDMIGQHAPKSIESTSHTESSPNTDPELHKQIESLREEMRRLKDFYANKSAITQISALPKINHSQPSQPLPESQTKSSSPASVPNKEQFRTRFIKSHVRESQNSVKRLHNNAKKPQADSENSHDNSKIPSTSPTKPHIPRKFSTGPRLLQSARRRLQVSVLVLERARWKVSQMWSPQLQPLAISIDEKHGVFERDLKEVFADVSTLKSLLVMKKNYLRKMEKVWLQPGGILDSPSDGQADSTSPSPSINRARIQSMDADECQSKSIQPVGGWSLEAATEKLPPTKAPLPPGNTIMDIRNHGGMTTSQVSEDAIMQNEAQLRVIQAFENTPADTQRLFRGLHTKAGVLKTSDSEESPPQLESGSASKEASSDELRERSLLEELFPEASSYIQPHYTTRNPYPKLELPKDVPLVRRSYTEAAKSQRQRILEAFQTRTEPLTVLQLTNCSTGLTESDFRRLVPKGKHIESWVRNGEFQKIIPGRDPLSLERLPFYYLVFKTPESALAYQANVSRLHKLSGLHQPSSIFSAIPPPRGFLEDGEDLNAVMSSYLLKPTTLKLNLNMVMQPYNPSLRALIEQGGYNPIVPNTDAKGHRIWKVMVHIEGWEPLREDLYHIFSRHAYDRGLSWPFHNETLGISKLRDLVDVKQKFQAVSSHNPRAASHDPGDDSSDDLNFNSLNVDPLEQSGGGKGTVSQVVMNRLYNRWIIEFDDEDAARRFARMWHRRILPASKLATWRDTEEPRMINAEFLW